MNYPKNTDITNIKCDKCQHPITYEYVSFAGCALGSKNPTIYAVKCIKCRGGYGPWRDFDRSLFPGYPIMKKTCCHCGGDHDELYCDEIEFE
jgi:hypothetical protein